MFRSVSRVEHESAVDELNYQLEELRAAQAEETEWLDSVLKKRIIVHTKQDQSIDGTLMEKMDDGIILRAARWLNAAPAPPTELAGELWIPKGNILFVQLDE